MTAFRVEVSQFAGVVGKVEELHLGGTDQLRSGAPKTVQRRPPVVHQRRQRFDVDRAAGIGRLGEEKVGVK